MKKALLLVALFLASLGSPVLSLAQADESSGMSVLHTTVNPANNNTYHLLTASSWRMQLRMPARWAVSSSRLTTKQKTRGCLTPLRAGTTSLGIFGSGSRMQTRKANTDGTMERRFYTENGAQHNPRRR